MALIDTIIVFVVSLLIGALGIYVGASVLTDYEDYTYAIITALIGAVVWAIIGFFFGWIPLLGPALALIAYITIINLRYPGGYGEAIGIALIAWVSVFVVLYALAIFDIFEDVQALGVPGI